MMLSALICLLCVHVRITMCLHCTHASCICAVWGGLRVGYYQLMSLSRGVQLARVDGGMASSSDLLESLFGSWVVPACVQMSSMGVWAFKPFSVDARS